MTAPAFLPGIFPSMTMGEYHALDAASNSRLNQLRRSPAHLRAYLDEPQKDTLAMKIGRAVHTAILEPDHFNQNFVIPTQCDAVTASGKNAGQRCANPGIKYRAEAGWLCGQHSKGLTSDESRIPLAPDAYATCTRARDAVFAHPIASKLVARISDVELSLAWDDAETNVRCKARLDGYVPELHGGVIIDIKTCIDASPWAFKRTIFQRGYDLQGAHYLNGAASVDMPAKSFINIAIEKNVAVVACYRLEDPLVTMGRTRLGVLLKAYDQCKRTGLYPGYSDEIVDIGIPEWSWTEIQNEMQNYSEDAA